jgi:hypothetical protein
LSIFKSQSEIPTPESNGFIKTLNNMGYMTSELDHVSQQFVDFSSQAPGPSLDIGAAYGVATLPVLQAGAYAIANDLDVRHLELLWKAMPPALRSRLTLCPGSFPYGISFMPNSIGAILVCRVLHFFDGNTILASARALHQWLAPGGKVFVVAETPYLRNFATFIPVYERRRDEGVEWPGFIEDVSQFAPERAVSLPKSMHLLDPTTLSTVFSKAGFYIEHAHTFARPTFPDDIRLDGRESVGLIATKPNK